VEAAQATLQQAEKQLEQAAAQLDQAKAQLLSGRSQVAQARAQVKQTQAAVDLAAVDLSYTVIRAPIDGVVIARSVDVGQTVAASLQAPTLFLIANDLTQMQVLANIDEADVGQLTPDSKVTFTVDAYPGDSFEGAVAQIRLNPETVQNVVTYTAVINVKNPELKLKPGMTANVTATVAERKDVLVAPNAALRFRPESAQGAGTARAGRPGRQALWTLAQNGQLRAIPVTLGISDGIHSEITSGDLKPGDQVITGQMDSKTAAQSGARNPMMPFGGRGGRR
jgi:HlyD family secretion protein